MMKKLVWILLLLLIAAGLVLFFFAESLPEAFRPASALITEAVDRVEEWINPQPDVPENLYDVVRAVDGDTLVIMLKGEETFVRLIGIDAPESVHHDQTKNTPEGQIASQRMKALVTGKKVSLEFDEELTDRYDRTLAYAYLDGELLEDTLLREGMAVTLVMEPNIRYQKHFETIEKQARESGAGFWGTGFFQVS